jgi:Flp pilus assembly protein TadB
MQVIIKNGKALKARKPHLWYPNAADSGFLEHSTPSNCGCLWFVAVCCVLFFGCWLLLFVVCCSVLLCVVVVVVAVVAGAGAGAGGGGRGGEMLISW